MTRHGDAGLGLALTAALAATVLAPACRTRTASSTSSPRDASVRWVSEFGKLRSSPAVGVANDGTVYAMAAIDADEPPPGYASAQGAHRMCLFALGPGGAILRRVCGSPARGRVPVAWVRTTQWGSGYGVDEDGGLYVLLSTGLERFEAGPGRVGGPPAINTHGEALVGGGNGLLALGVGREPVARFVAETGTSSRGPVIAADESIYVARGTRLFAMSPLGEVRWAVPSPFGIPELGGDSVFVADDRVLVAFATSSGERLWEYAAPTRFRTAPVSGGGDTVYIIEQPSILHAVRQGTKLWTYVADGSSGDLTVARDGELHLTAGEKLYCISPEGRRRWLIALRGAEGKPAPGPDGTVYVAFKRVAAVLNADTRTSTLQPHPSTTWERLRRAEIDIERAAESIARAPR